MKNHSSKVPPTKQAAILMDTVCIGIHKTRSLVIILVYETYIAGKKHSYMLVFLYGGKNHISWFLHGIKIGIFKFLYGI